MLPRVLVAALVSSLCSARGAPGGSRIATWSIEELFGVSYPRQVLDFDYSGKVNPAVSYMIGPDGTTEVPFQVLHNGHIAVQADLPSRAHRSWTLYSGHPPRTFSGLVTLKTEPGYFEVSNGQTGVRVLRPHPGADLRLAPIQGIQLRDGRWICTGPNFLYGDGDANPQTLTAKTTTATVVEQGPLEVSIQVHYTYDRPGFFYGGKLLIAGGPGSYTSTITLDAGAPCITVLDDTDMDLQYRLFFGPALVPNEARYRGHLSNSVETGHLPGGGIYRPGHERPPVDAYRDLQYAVPGYSGYVSGKNEDEQLIRRMAIWDPWVYDSGWYWMVYDKTAPPDAPVMGMFAGRASQALGLCNSGPGIYTVPAGATEGPGAGIAFQTHRGCPDATLRPRVRISWGIFVGTRRADLGDPYQVQNINRLMNQFGGFNLNKVYRYSTAYPDPPNGYASLYMKRPRFAALVRRVQTDPAYYQHLYGADATARPLLDAWRDMSGRKAHDLVLATMDLAKRMLDSLVNGEGIYSPQYHYWHGGQQMSAQAAVISALLAGDQVSPEDRAQLKAAAALFASILWDDDFVPMQGGVGVNMGTPNMPVQQIQYRTMFALMLPMLPMFRDRDNSVRAGAAMILDSQVNAAGAQRGSPHYSGAAMGPLLNTFQQIQAAGPGDPFRSEPKLAEFAGFYLNMLTPPEPRFGGLRKLISIGDGATEAEPGYMFGQLATAFAEIDPALSARLMQAWIECGRPHAGNIGSSILKIDEQLPAAPVNLGSANFPGYGSVLRNDAGTPDETAIWLVNGNFYSDHRHEDNGSVSIYALDAPLSIDWGSMYSPHTAGAYVHSAVVPESLLPQPWDAPAAPLDLPCPWKSSGNSFTAFGTAARAIANFRAASGTGWTRMVESIHPNPAYPVILIKDTFSGSASDARNIFTLNLMSDAAVETPSGAVVPPLRLFSSSGQPQELPSATPAVALQPGINRFHFTGQWRIDYDLFTVAGEAQQFSLGNWAHDWAPAEEASQYKNANNRRFRERQNIFRLRGARDFTVVILPYHKGYPSGSSVRTDNGNLVISNNNMEMVIYNGGSSFSYKGPTNTAVAAFDSEPVAAYGISIAGGPAEVNIRQQSALVRLSGVRGIRHITLPGTWEQDGKPVKNGSITVNFDGHGEQLLRLAAISPKGA